jgi:hypothetical protein
MDYNEELENRIKELEDSLQDVNDYVVQLRKAVKRLSNGMDPDQYLMMYGESLNKLIKEIPFFSQPLDEYNWKDGL